MPEPANYKELAKRYGLAPLPDSVLQITQLLSRQDADLDQIAKVISKDAALTKRLLRAASPRSTSEDDYAVDTVEEALMRTGLGCVLLLAMGAPLTFALIKTFQTMLNLKLESVHPKSVDQFPGQHILCTIGFSGKAEGQVYLRMNRDGACKIAAGILGMKPEEFTNEAELNDTVGELLNIVTGNFKSNLCDAGLDCRLTPPSVSRSSDFHVKTIQGGGLERMAFQAGDIVIFVDVTVNPWSD